jgi:flagellar protein FliO/FliZ
MIKSSLTPIVLLASAPIHAAQAPNLDLATTAGSLVFVIIFILFLAWVLKRMKLPTMTGQKDFKVVRQMTVGTKERMMVIQVGEEQFLIGATTQSIQLISKLDTPLKEDNSSVLNTSFASILNKKVDKNSASRSDHE